MNTPTRQLAAIVIAEVEDYGILVETDETGTSARFEELAEEIVKPLLKQYRGRLAKAEVDSMLMTFTSSVAAVNFVIDVQRTLPVHQSQWPEHSRLRFRMGVHLGEVILEGDTAHGVGVDGVTGVAELAEPGGVVISGPIFDQAHRRLEHVAYEDLGPQHLKNLDEPVPAYRILLDPSKVEELVREPTYLTNKRVIFYILILVILAGAALWKL